MLKGRKIILAVTGSIAAYKAAFLIRLLKKQGAEVKVIMTPSAHEFITPLTLSTLSKEPVLSDFIENKKTGSWTNHVELGLWADVMLIAPATANTIAKLANGICDDLLQAVYLSLRCKAIVAPAMDLDMWNHPATQNNVKLLQQFGHSIIAPGKGELASGLNGEGRMAEPEEIVSYLESFFDKRKFLQGKKILITAGPTYEAIDPVRFIGNHSSGKMGIALAESALEAGAEVTLICGPSGISSHEKIKRINITTAAEMLSACKKWMLKSDILVMAAAVADYRPAKIAKQKIKKENAALDIQLEPTVDILKWMGATKTSKQVLVGFALETNNELENAKKKLKSKNLDFIILNSLNDNGAGFGVDTNKITLIDKRNKITTFGLQSKKELAVQLWPILQKALK